MRDRGVPSETEKLLPLVTGGLTTPFPGEAGILVAQIASWGSVRCVRNILTQPLEMSSYCYVSCPYMSKSLRYSALEEELLLIFPALLSSSFQIEILWNKTQGLLKGKWKACVRPLAPHSLSQAFPWPYSNPPWLGMDVAFVLKALFTCAWFGANWTKVFECCFQPGHLFFHLYINCKRHEYFHHLSIYLENFSFNISNSLLDPILERKLRSVNTRGHTHHSVTPFRHPLALPKLMPSYLSHKTIHSKGKGVVNLIMCGAEMGLGTH